MRKSRIFNFNNLGFGQFPMLLIISFCYTQTMNAIFYLRTPFQIFNPIIGTVAILMVYNWLVFGVGNKRFCNDSVNGSFASYMNVDITAFVQIKIKQLAVYGSCIVSKLNSIVKASNVSKRACLVFSFIPFNVFPCFHRCNLDIEYDKTNKVLKLYF